MMRNGRLLLSMIFSLTKQLLSAAFGRGGKGKGQGGWASGYGGPAGL